jgi:hypothetical protein
MPRKKKFDLDKEVPFNGTPTTTRLCKDMAKRSTDKTGKSTCFLLFSRGKDALATALFLRRFFSRVIPVHFTLVPGLRFVNESLEFYEKVFGWKALRFLMPYGMARGIGNMQWQYEEDEDIVYSELDLWDFEYYNVIDLLKKELGLPERVWTAEGYLMSDSIFRRMSLNKNKGKDVDTRTFYPIYDWTPTQVLEMSSQYDLPLSPDYLMSGRTLCGVPHPQMFERIEELYPDDFEKLKLYYPFLEASMARKSFRIRQKLKKQNTSVI